MPTRRSIHALLSMLLLASSARIDAVTLDRPPEILELRQVGTTVRVLWAQGGDDDGTLHEYVDYYKVERRIGTGGSWTEIFESDEDTGGNCTGADDDKAMSHVDDVTAILSWWDSNQSLYYRVTAVTCDSTATVSQDAVVDASLPVWIGEAREGKARVAWVPSTAPTGYSVHLGYIVQKNILGSGWVDQTGYLSDTSWIDPNTVTGAPRSYRVQTVYKQAPPGVFESWRASNTQTITVPPMCAGETPNPYANFLTTIDIVDQDSDGYDGDDIAAALDACDETVYEDLSQEGGDDDGIWEPGNGEVPVSGGCILRARPVTYENVSIMITDSLSRCNDQNGTSSSTWGGDLTHPEHCMLLDLQAGLVIEGHGPETVFRSPVWEQNEDDPPQYLPASILEFYHQTTRITLRNLVLDGRKHEQVSPNFSDASTWHHFGFRVWSMEYPKEILGDGVGNESSLFGLGPPSGPYPYEVCDYETCIEDEEGENDADGRCEAGEECVEDPAATTDGDNDGVCETDYFPDATTCEAPIDNQNGCIHNVEFRNFMGTGAKFNYASNWIIEHSRFHDIGCMNRGYGWDCPYMDEAADYPPASRGTPVPGYKTDGYGLDVNDYTSNFKVRRNEVYRTLKYGLGFKNGSAIACNGQATDHEISLNHLHDVGFVGVFNHGAVGTRMSLNLIDGTTLFGEDSSWNSSNNSYGLSLGGYCSDDNEFTYNWIWDMAGTSIWWTGETQLKTCDEGSGCTPVASVGNTIANNTMSGACMQKEGGPGETYGFGAVHMHAGAGGEVFLTDNTLAGSECRFAVSAFGPAPGVEPLTLRISGGSYQVGASSEDDGFYSGPLHAHGDGRKIVVDHDTSIQNTTSTTIPKVSVGYGATIVIDDVVGETPSDPFADGPYGTPSNGGSPLGEVVVCSDGDNEEEHEDCIEPTP